MSSYVNLSIIMVQLYQYFCTVREKKGPFVNYLLLVGEFQEKYFWQPHSNF